LQAFGSGTIPLSERILQKYLKLALRPRQKEGICMLLANYYAGKWLGDKIAPLS
jgi:hypothetical protein